jgi:hypothetical protein
MHFSKLLATAALLLVPAIADKEKLCDYNLDDMVNETSDASPLAADCLQLAKNIEDSGEWTVHAGQKHRELAQYGTCAVGVEKQLTILTLHVGNMDVVPHIVRAVDRFTRDGKVGAKASMRCKGIWWTGGFTLGIYHT